MMVNGFSLIMVVRSQRVRPAALKHIAACVAAHARLVLYVAIGWSVLLFQANAAGPKI